LNKPRKHHYVPQTYLKNFCNSVDKPDSIYVYDKINHKKFKANIQDIAAERDFYKVAGKDDEYYWEHFYSKEFESKYPSVIRTLNTACSLSVNNAVILTSNLKEELSYMICVQLLRTKKAREYQLKTASSAGEKKLNQLKEELPKYLNKDQKELLDKFELTEDFLKDVGLETINDKHRLKIFIGYLFDKNWVIYYNTISNRIPFNTSDHPVCYYNVLSKRTGFEDNGLAVTASKILFPISSKLLIGIYNKELYLGTLKQFDGQMIKIDEENFINKINDIQLEQCYRQCYSSIG